MYVIFLNLARTMAKTSLEEEYRSQEEYRRRAATGDPEALFHLAWDYFKGRLVAKDLQMAITLLRQLEEKSPEWARFNIAKMKYLEGDDSFKDEIQADCDAGFGPALYLMAANSQRKGGQMSKSEALGYFRAAAQSGHIPSKIWVWRLSKLGFWRRLATVIPLLFTVVRFFAIGVRNYNDVRVLV
jgi:TPR repeat protein